MHTIKRKGQTLTVSKHKPLIIETTDWDVVEDIQALFSEFDDTVVYTSADWSGMFQHLIHYDKCVVYVHMRGMQFCTLLRYKDVVEVPR